MSAFTALGLAMQTLLLAAPPIVGGNRVWRGRLSPLKTGFESALVIKQVSTSASRADVANGPTDWSSVFAVECHARCAANQVPEDVVDPLLAAVFARLAGAGAGLALGVEDLLPDPQIDWDLGEGDTPLVCATLVVRIVHRTQAAQLVAWT